MFKKRMADIVSLHSHYTRHSLWPIWCGRYRLWPISSFPVALMGWHTIKELVQESQSYFGFKLPSELWSKRVERFDVKYASCGGSVVNYGTNVIVFTARC